MLALIGGTFSVGAIHSDHDCDLTAATDIYLKWDEYASETGLYTVSGDTNGADIVECTGVSPKLHLNMGQTYAFHQTDVSNWYHPVGFAYEPGGAHFDLPELEDEALQYYVNDVPITDDESGFGLDGYEPLFFYPEEAWLEHSFKVHLTVPDVTAFYYFCHIHSGMSANIHVVNPSNGASSPMHHDDYFIEPPVVSQFDEECGTVGVEDFVHAHGRTTCQDKHFLCGSNLDSGFNTCLQAIDCKMHVDMAVHTDDDPVKTFMRQMIPHHANAVSMAKVLLKHAEVEDEVASLARAIINVQNHQIQYMQGYLGDDGGGEMCYEEDNGCPSGCVPASRRSRRLLFATSPCGVGCVAA